MLKQTKIIEALPETITNQFDFTAVYHKDANTDISFTVFNSDFFVTELYQHFSDRNILLDEDNPDTALVSLFGIWKASRADVYARRMYALSINYDPLNNYDRTETKSGSSSVVHGETVTRTHNDTSTESYNNYKETNTKTGNVTTADGLYGVNSVTAVNSDTSTETYNNVKDENAITGSKSDAHTGTIADAHTGTDSTTDGYTLTAKGNIGVTTSAAMLSEDLDLLKHDIALTAVCDFIDRYTWVLEGLSL